MNAPNKPASSATCVAPVGDDPELCGRPTELCGRPASKLRIVEGVLVRLCEACARELDREVSN